MSYYSSRATDCKVYIGDLGTGAAKDELERAFDLFGPLRTVWVARNPPGFAFVEYENHRDAEDAVKSMDGKFLCGNRIRVEMSTGMSRRGRGGRPGKRRFDPNDRCYQCGDRGHYAYDCKSFKRGGGGVLGPPRRSSRSRSRSPALRSRSRSRGHRYRSRSRSRGSNGSRRQRSVSRSSQKTGQAALMLSQPADA